MTQNYHTPIVNDDPRKNDAAIWNDPMGQLDAAIGTTDTEIAATTAEVVAARNGQPSLDARLDAFSLVGAGSAWTQASGIHASGQADIDVDTAGNFTAGMRVQYQLTDGSWEANTIASISAPTITHDNNLSQQVDDNAPYVFYPDWAYETAQSINTNQTPLLSDAMRWAAQDVFNVKAYGAIGDGASHALSTADAATYTFSEERETVDVTGTGTALDLIGFNITNAPTVKSLDELTTYTVTTDYTIDTTNGTITVVAGGQIDLDNEVVISVSYEWAATNAAETDWAALVAASQAARDNGGGIVFLPRGRYETNFPVPLYENVSLHGTGRGETNIESNSWIVYSGTTNAIEINGENASQGRRSITIRDVNVRCTNAGANAAIWMDWVTGFEISRVRFQGDGTYAIYMQNCYEGNIRNCQIRGFGYGAYITIKAANPIFSGQSLIENCRFIAQTTANVEMNSSVNTLRELVFIRCLFQGDAGPIDGFRQVGGNANAPLFIGCQFETIDGAGVFSDGAVTSAARLYACHFNNVTTCVDANGDRLTMRDCTATQGALGASGVLIDGEKSIVENCRFTNFPVGIRVKNSAVDTRLERNFIDGATTGIDILASAVRTILDNNLYGANTANVSDASGDVAVGDEIIWTSQEFDFSGGTVGEVVMRAAGQLYIRKIDIIYTEASAGAGTTTLRFGDGVDNDRYLSFTTEVSKSINDVTTIDSATLSSVFITVGRVLRASCVGGSGAAGAAKMVVYMSPYSSGL